MLATESALLTGSDVQAANRQMEKIGTKVRIIWSLPGFCFFGTMPSRIPKRPEVPG